MHIYVPSTGRAHLVGGPARTLAAIPDRGETSLVVPVHEFERYQRLNLCSVLACPEYGIAATRRWIGEHARETGHSSFMMMDDDLRFSRRLPDGTKLRPFQSDGRDWRDMMQAAEALMREGATAVGISTRQGNNRHVESIVRNTRLLRAFAFRTNSFLHCEHGRVPVMEDFDVLLQLLRAGHENCCITEFAQDQPGTQTEGGCSGYRTHELHEQAAHKLAELHPGLVRLREKRNKTGGAFGTRTEVTISWKKAYGHG